MKTGMLSVIIPAYNAELYLKEAVESVMRQRWQGDREIIIVDDASSDGTAALAASLGCCVIRSSLRSGAASARNKGISAAGGEWILLLDADDVLADDAAEALYRPFEADPGTVAVFGKAEDFVSRELSADQAAELKPRRGSYDGILPGCSLIRKRVFDTVGLFDESLKSGETVDWIMKLRESGMKTARIDAVTLKRRIHLTNTGRVDRSGEMRNYAALLRKRMIKR